MPDRLTLSGILLYLAPSFVVLMGAALWKAPITRRKLTALALAFAKALPTPDPKLLESLDRRVQRIAQRQKEEKAHQRNKRTGKKKQ